MRGHVLKGADIAIGGNMPQGAGLSSSASVEVVIGETFKCLNNLSITSKEIALNGQEAENNFIGKRGGVRMTGGGFGGCLVAILPSEMVEGAKQLLARHY